MGKISPVSGKYIIHASIKIDGTVEKPDVIGAIFGQTEGLLGSELELRELQRSGRIGRIEVNVNTKGGKVDGTIIIPSSLDKAETAIIGAALEIIERIGPCNADIRVQEIKDIRIAKRQQVVDRAKELLQGLMTQVMPDSMEIAEEVGESVRKMEVVEFGPDKLPAGPAIADSEEIILVEGRADVVNLLKYGIKNAVAMNGASVPQGIIDLAAEKTVTVFVDGDRGGDLNVKELHSVAEIDFVCQAPDGKEVEELTQKEILKALRGKLTPEQFIAEIGNKDKNRNNNRHNNRTDTRNNNRNDSRNDSRNTNRNDRNTNRNDSRNTNRNDRNDRPPREFKKPELSAEERAVFGEVIQEMLGSKGACLLDESANILGKVPIKELETTLKSLKGSVHAVAIDGPVTAEVVSSCEDAKVKFAIGMKVAPEAKKSRVTVYAAGDL